MIHFPLSAPPNWKVAGRAREAVGDGPGKLRIGQVDQDGQMFTVGTKRVSRCVNSCFFLANEREGSVGDVPAHGDFGAVLFRVLEGLSVHATLNHGSSFGADTDEHGVACWREPMTVKSWQSGPGRTVRKI